MGVDRSVKKFTAIRFDRVQAILADEPFFKEMRKGPLVKVGNRCGKVCQYPPAVIAVVEALARQGLDGHTVAKERVLALAFEMQQSGQPVRVKEQYITNTTVESMKADEVEVIQSFSDRLKAMLVEADAEVSGIKDQIDKHRLKLKGLAAEQIVAERNARQARAAVAALGRMGKPGPNKVSKGTKRTS